MTPRNANRGAGRGRCTDEFGAVGLWLLGLSVLLLGLGGVSLDLWRAFAERRVLAAAVDAAAAAAAAAIDEAAYRAEGEVRLVPGEALLRGHAHLDLLLPPSTVARDVQADAGAVTVSAAAEVPLTLLRVLLPDEEPLVVRARAVAVPQAAP